jgi:Uma2 family endonuclease
MMTAVLLVLCDYQRFIDEDDRYGGLPSLVAEILSPSTRSRDKVKKMDLYMDSRIREYG